MHSFIYQGMRNIGKSRLSYYIAVFVLILAANSIVRRLLPYDELKDGNLFVNAMGSLILTILFAVADSIIRHIRKRG